jgi:hypothetical protein
MVENHIPHLASFRQDNEGIHFHIALDDQYWSAIARLTRTFKTTLRYDQATREFNLPVNARTLVHMLLIFPVEWAIIQERSPKEMSFPPRKESGRTHVPNAI